MTNPRNGEPWLASAASWAVLTASFGLSASTWIDLGLLAGFTAHLTIGHLTLRMAWLLPVAVDGYVVVALVLWMAPVPATVARFAKRNTYGAASIGIAAQSAYHLLFTLSVTDQGWRVALAAVVGALPPAVAALAVHMRALIRRESTNHTTTPVPAVVTVPLSTVQPPRPAATAGLDPEPGPVPVVVPDRPVAPLPTPAQVATRITPPAPTTGRSADVPARTAPTSGPPPASPAASRAPLAPPATDSPVTASGAAQPMPTLADPAQLGRARQIAAQYRTEHATPITAGRLALRMKVSSDQAAALLAAIEGDQPNPSTQTVNGRLLRATR
jgi:hypothetical protein